MLWIDTLHRSFGSVKEPVSDEKLFNLYKAKDYSGMVGFAQSKLCIDLQIRLGLVNSGGRVAPAWINLPEDMPLIGTSMFRSTSLTMYIRKSFLMEATFEQVVVIIAHELCHIILSGTRHLLQQTEEAVDLTAMLLGFRDFYMTGRHQVVAYNLVYSSHVGYLTSEEISFAATYMTLKK